MTPIYQHAPFHGKDVKVMPGDVVACRADRWRVGIVLKVRENGCDPCKTDECSQWGCVILLDNGRLVGAGEILAEQFVLLERGDWWYDESEWRVCSRFDSITSLMRHFGVRRMWRVQPDEAK